MPWTFGGPGVSWGSLSGVPAGGFLLRTDGYSLKMFHEQPPQAGKPISEGVEAVWKPGQIAACRV